MTGAIQKMSRAGVQSREVRHYANGGLVSSIKERFFKAATPAPAPAPTPAPAPPPNAISGYAGMSAMQRREQAAGLKDGGPVRGPGTGTSDSVPAMLSNGEFVMPADSTREIGVEVLTALRDATHTEVKPKAGAIRKMANGGLVDDERRKQLVNQIPRDTFSGPANPVTSTELGRNVSNTLSAVPGISPVLGAVRGLSAASSALPSAGGVVSRLATATAPVAPYAPVAGGMAAVSTASAPSTPAPVQPGQAPARPVAAPQAAAAPAPAPAAGPGTAGNIVVNGNSFSGTDVGTNPAYVNADGSQSNFGAARGPIATMASAPADIAGIYARTSQTYKDMAKINEAYDQPGVMSNGGGMRVVGGPSASFFRQAGGHGSAAEGATPSMSRLPPTGMSNKQMAALETSAAQNATSRANNQASVAAQLAGQETSAGATRYGVDTQAKTAAQRMAMEAPEQQAKTQLTISTLAARQAYAKALASGDPKQVQQAEDNLRAISGKFEKEAPDLFTTTAIPGGVDPSTGMPRGAGAIVTNRRDGTVKIISADEAKGQAAPKFETGKVYQDAKGTKAKWDGNKFVPA